MDKHSISVNDEWIISEFPDPSAVQFSSVHLLTYRSQNRRTFPEAGSLYGKEAVEST